MKKNFIANDLTKEEVLNKFEEMGYNVTEQEVNEAIGNGDIALKLPDYQDHDFYDIVKHNNNFYDILG